MFNRAPLSFILLASGVASGTSFRLTIKKAVLYITRLKMRTGTRIPREVGYNYTSYETRYFMIPSGGQVISQEILNGPCPNRLFFVMVNQSAFFGDMSKNPFHFPTNLLASVYLKKNNVVSIPAEPYTTEVETVGTVKQINMYNRFYRETMKVCCLRLDSSMVDLPKVDQWYIYYRSSTMHVGFHILRLG